MHRLQSNDLAARMPNIGNRIVHEEAVELIRQWISQMEHAKEEQTESRTRFSSEAQRRR